MIGLSKPGRGKGSGEYYLQGAAINGEALLAKNGLNYTGKLSHWYGAPEIMAKLGLAHGDPIEEQTFRCINRGLDPSKSKVAFHLTGGDFNPQGLMKAIWADATKKERTKILKLIREAYQQRQTLVLADARAAGMDVDDLAVQRELLKSLYATGINRLSKNASPEVVTRSYEKLLEQVPVPDSKDRERLENLAYRAATKVPGYTLTKDCGPGRVTGIDLTATLSKDFSVLWAMSPPEVREVLKDILETASHEVVDYLNTYAGTTRAGKGGADSIDCKYVASLFTDFVARPVDQFGAGLPEDKNALEIRNGLGNGIVQMFIDPHLHCHIFVSNSVLSGDGKWRSIDQPRFYQAQAAAGERLHASVAHQLKERLGLRVEVNALGPGFRILDVPQEATDECSKRTQIIELQKKKLGIDQIPNSELGRSLLQTIKLDTRNDHLTLENTDLDAHIQGRLTAVGFSKDVVANILEEGQQRFINREYVENVPSREQVLECVNEILETESDFSDHKLRAVVLGKFTASCSADRILDVIDRAIEIDLVHLGEFDRRETFSTVEMIALEARYLDVSTHGTHDDQIKPEQINKSITLIDESKRAEGKAMSGEQKDGAEYLLAGNRMVSVLVGPAGGGKTYTLEAVQHCLKASGYTILGSALSWSASEQLRAEGKLDQAVAVAKLAHNIKSSIVALDSKTCIVLDEGSLIGSWDIGVILTAAHEAGSKVIITGDIEQIQSVSAGSAMRAIVERAGCFELTEVRRQKDEADRQAGLNIRAGGDRLKDGMDYHLQKGRLHCESSQVDAVKALFARWKEDHLADPNATQLMIAKSNVDVDALNAMARDTLRSTGKLGHDHPVDVKISNTTKELNLAVGDYIQFRTKSASIQLNEGDEIIDGQVFNRTRASIRNIETDAKGNVKSISVELWNGDSLIGKTAKITPQDFRGDHFSLEHAWAVTAHSSQGMTVDKCYCLPGGMNKSLGYVSMTRHRADLQMFISRNHMHEMSARYMDRVKVSAASPDGYVERSRFTNAMAYETLISTLQRRAGKQTTLDRISSKSQIADQSCLAGSRFEMLVRTDEQLAKTLRHIVSVREKTATVTAYLKHVSEDTQHLVQSIKQRNLARGIAVLQAQGLSITPTSIPTHLPKEFSHELSSLHITHAIAAIGVGPLCARIDKQDALCNLPERSLEIQHVPVEKGRTRNEGLGPDQRLLPDQSRANREALSYTMRRSNPGAEAISESKKQSRSETQSTADNLTASETSQVQKKFNVVKKPPVQRKGHKI